MEKHEHHLSLKLTAQDKKHLEDLHKDMTHQTLEFGLPVPSKSDVVRATLARAWSDLQEMRNGTIPVRFVRAKEERDKD